MVSTQGGWTTITCVFQKAWENWHAFCHTCFHTSVRISCAQSYLTMDTPTGRREKCDKGHVLLESFQFLISCRWKLASLCRCPFNGSFSLPSGAWDHRIRLWWMWFTAGLRKLRGRHVGLSAVRKRGGRVLVIKSCWLLSSQLECSWSRKYLAVQKIHQNKVPSNWLLQSILSIIVMIIAKANGKYLLDFKAPVKRFSLKFRQWLDKLKIGRIYNTSGTFQTRDKLKLC